MPEGLQLYNSDGKLTLDSNTKVLARKGIVTPNYLSAGRGYFQTPDGNKTMHFYQHIIGKVSSNRMVAPWVTNSTGKYISCANSYYNKLLSPSTADAVVDLYVEVNSSPNILITHADWANDTSGYLDVFNSSGEMLWSVATLSKLPIIIGVVDIPPDSLDPFYFNIPSQYQTGGKIYVLGPGTATYTFNEGIGNISLLTTIKSTQVVFSPSIYYSGEIVILNTSDLTFNKVYVGYVPD